MNLRASDRTVRDKAQAYLDARDRVAAPFLKKYPGRLPRPVARQIHRLTVRELENPSHGLAGERQVDAGQRIGSAA